MSVDLNDILIAHWILFDYNVDDSICFMEPHHLFKIEDSIHFKALTSNDYKVYNRLIETTNQKEHSELKFKELKESFNTSTFHEDKIHIVYNNDLEKYIVQDGCHRLSIIKLHALADVVPRDWFLIE